jgi:ABC-type antimicrobial peptide transport system permease subunit
MIRNYLRVAFRNLRKNKIYSFINIIGLSAGMAVAMLIGLWVVDELRFDRYHPNYDQIAQVYTSMTYKGETGVQDATPPPMGNELRSLYGNQFKHVLMSSAANRMILSSGDKKMMKTGYYFEPGVTDMLSLKMLKGSREGLKNPASVLLSASVAKALFGDADPMDKLMKIDNRLDVTVTGVYEDLPLNTSFSDMSFIAPWDLYTGSNEWIRKNDWEENGFRTYVQIADHTDMQQVSAKIRNVALNKAQWTATPALFLFPMHQWHLYAEFENGVNAGGKIRFVWLYGTIGIFILLLACINFMNLATARSEKRAKEVGIRKAIGSFRGQLISQFLSESLLVVTFAFILSLILTQLLFPFFNEIAGKKMSIPWGHPLFWIAGIVFSLITAGIAGSYPALYLSSFQPVKVLKGTFNAGRFAAIPRKVLVVLQFTVSITLVVCVIIVFRQIRFGKDRAVGYAPAGLIMVETNTPEIHEHISAVRDELKKSGAAVEIAESLNPMTGMSFTTSYNWGTDESSLGTVWVSPEFGRSVGWEFSAGRDFTTDSSGMVLNESAVKLMGLKDPIGHVVKTDNASFHITGVIKDMLMESPFEPVRPSVYLINPGKGNFVNVRLNPAMSIGDALKKISHVFSKYNPASPFEYRFVDQEFARKFGDEERISKLATFFAVLAIGISCLGLFGMASFMAEQRVKEIGIRKILGASVFSLWRLLSKDFVMLVLTALIFAVPTAYWFMNNWLQHYQYRTEMHWWIFTVAGAGAMFITLLTVSFQAVRAALMNPVRSLKTE